jgi:hypothetical protein
VIDRLRLLLDRPLDPQAARAVMVLATAILLGFAAVFALGVSEPDRPAISREQIAQPPRVAAAPVEEIAPKTERRSRRNRQDPQDERDSAAGRRAAHALRFHRALQHVPYRRGSLTVNLVGARGGRALLRVRAPTPADARRGWRAFLRRYRDDGRAYLPRFKARQRPHRAVRR